jgi:hypothetical protein
MFFHVQVNPDHSHHCLSLFSAVIIAGWMCPSLERAETESPHLYETEMSAAVSHSS